MPLTGELEHLPIVDVVQLIHSTRKSGTLNVYSRKGEGQLVFNCGYIVGASHSNEKLRIGQILCDSKIITEGELEKALDIQQRLSEKRKPLIATLLEHCGLSKESAFKALETLIELTIVEMISWTKGFFSLEIDKIHIFDEYRYLPTQLQELNLDTQMVLMDALRIFDEKVHAGEIQIVDEPLEKMPVLAAEEEEEEIAPDEANEEIIVSEDILGLADLDKIERKKPHVFKSLEAFDPAEIHRQTIIRALPELTDNETEQLANFLTTITKPSFFSESGIGLGSAQAIILFSADEFLRHALMTVCKTESQLVFTTDNSAKLSELISLVGQKKLEPILLYDAPCGDNPNFLVEALSETRSALFQQHPEIPALQLASPHDFSFTLASYNAGIRAVIPKPLLAERRESFVDGMLAFLETLQNAIHSCYTTAGRQHFANLRNSLFRLSSLGKAPEISLEILQFIGKLFVRSLTLIVDQNDLIAERSIGIDSDKDQGVSAAQKFRFCVEEESIFHQVMTTGEVFCGSLRDATLEKNLFPEIGAPLESTILLAPLKSNNRTITLTYADFGNSKSCYVPLEFIAVLLRHGGLAMENALLRRQLEKKAKPQEKN